MFDSSEKELIGVGRAHWLTLQKEGAIQLKYLPGRDKQLKLTRNALALSQQNTKLILPYKLEEGKENDNLQPVVRKLQSLPLEVLSDAVLWVQVLEFHPKRLPPHKLLTLTCPALSLTLHSQTHCPITQQAFVAIPGMQLDIEATMTFKNFEQYQTMPSKCQLKLKNLPLKTNITAPLTLVFEDHFFLQCRAIVLYNKFTSAPEGTLQLKQLSFRGNSPTQLSLTFLNSHRESTVIREGALKEFDSIDRTITTVGLTDAFEMTMERNGRKFKEVVRVAELQVDRYGDNYVWERLVRLGSETAIATFRLTYSPTKLTDRKHNTLQYKLSNRELFEMEYPTEHIADHPASQVTARPKREKGTLVTATLPGPIAEGTRQVRLWKEGRDEDWLELQPSVAEPTRYSCYSNQPHGIRRVELVPRSSHSHEESPVVEYLGEREGVQKYMLNHNPRHVCGVTQEHCLLADTQEQQWQVRVVVHRACNSQQSRLLALANTPHDQVLTHQLGLAVKHSSQLHLARSLDALGVR